MLNLGYIAGLDGAGAPTTPPDCGHPDCGLLCDVELLARRPNGGVADAVAAWRERSRADESGPVKALLAMGYAFNDVARLLGERVEVVLGLVSKLAPADALAVERLVRDEGLAATAVARQLGLPLKPVRHLHELCAGRATREARCSRRDEALRLLAEGLAAGEVAERLGVTSDSVRALAYRTRRRRSAA